VFAEGVADFEVLEPTDQLLRLVVQLAQFGMTHLVDAFHLPHHQFGIADDLERFDLVFGGVAESGEESLILGVVIGVEAKVFAELGNRLAGGVLNGDTVTGGAGIAAGSAINVRRVGGRRGFRRGEKIAGAGRARRHGSSLQRQVGGVLHDKSPGRLLKNSGFVSGHRFSDAVSSLNSYAPLGAAY